MYVSLPYSTALSGEFNKMEIVPTDDFFANNSAVQRVI